MERTDPDTLGTEPALLSQFLDYHRATLVMKASGLDRAQFDQATAASDLTLGALVKHLALVEDSWFCNVMLGEPLPEPWASVDWDADPDWDLHSAVDDEPQDLLAPVRRSLRAQPGRGRPPRRPRRGEPGPAPQRAHVQPAVGAAAHDRGDRPPQRARRPAA